MTHALFLQLFLFLQLQFIYIFHILEWLSLCDCLYDPVHFLVAGVASQLMSKHEHSRQLLISYEIKLQHKYTQTYPTVSWDIYDPVFRPKCTTHHPCSVSLPTSLAITTYHWFITQTQNILSVRTSLSLIHISTKHPVSQNITLTKT